MPENRAHNHYKKRNPNSICQRIESWTGSGIFDSVWLFKDRSERWVEYKEIEQKKSHPNCSYKIPLRDKQIAWAKRRLLFAGVNNLEVAVLIGSELLVLKLTLERLELLKNPIEFRELKKMSES